MNSRDKDNKNRLANPPAPNICRLIQGPGSEKANLPQGLHARHRRSASPCL